MEDLQEYLKERLNEFRKTYNVEYYLNAYSDKELKRQWKSDYERTRGQWQSIKSISDVKRYVNGFVGTVKQFQNIKGLFSDAYDMDLALYRAVCAIQKMAQCYDIEDFDFHMFQKDDIDEMFDTMYQWLEEMKNVNMRRAMQD
ncbi:hypothetical protein [Velocimicrobium porci]|mgnify:CR=1 FL=1|uniref:Uncharacterized protein n=1 Tax=Velocimicrobium porci TaxID=2606634 RepID=A0A6L5Y192_9FIRM|nr:hypothetical protein [Velocimicrobium porci]MSS64178.1 hypothetical protein [Velocimicrobium porci]